MTSAFRIGMIAMAGLPSALSSSCSSLCCPDLVPERTAQGDRMAPPLHLAHCARDLALLCCITLIAAAVHAQETTYVYVGNGFDTFVDEPLPAESYAADSFVSMRLTLQDPLGPGLTDAAIAPLSYVITDGRVTITEAGPGYPDDQEFIVSTNAAGEITAWSISVTTYQILIFDYEEIASISNGTMALDRASITECTLAASFCLETGVDVGSISGNPGTWSRARFELLSPSDASTPCSAPTFSWGAGDYDLFYVYTLFDYYGAGPWPKGFFTTDTSFEMTAGWWGLLGSEQPSSWVVVGIDNTTRTFEISDTWSFTRPFSGPLDPTGTWSWEQDWDCGSAAFTSTLTLDSCGNYASAVGSGTWDLAGDQITLDSGRNVVFVGTLDATSDSMAGTATDSNAPGVTACWSATRIANVSQGSPGATRTEDLGE